MTEVNNESNEIAQQIQALEKSVIEKITTKWNALAWADGVSIIRFSKDHRVEVDEYGCLSAVKFHTEYLIGAPEALDERILYLQNTPYCSNIIFDENRLHIQNQIIVSKSEGFQHQSSREGFEWLPIETTPQTTIDDPAIVLKYYQSLNELIDKQLSQSSEIKEILEW